MFALDEELVYSATDLTVALTCEYAVLRRADEVLGRAERLEVTDLVRDRAAALGDAHEARVLAGYRERFGEGVVEIPGVEEWTREQLQAQHAASVAAMVAGAPVVAQAGFFDGRFHGRADFLVREGEGEARYAVVDAKLARRAKGTAVLQLAAYADQLVRAGIPLGPTTHLHLGNDVVTSHDAADSLVVMLQIRAHVERLVDGHAATEDVVSWGDPRITACGWCDYCRSAIEPARDLRLVWGMRNGTRDALLSAGVTTIDDLATGTSEVTGVNPLALARFRAQAQLQLRQERAEQTGVMPSVFAQVHTLDPLDALPAPDPGDVFFDFEGDPMWVDEDRSSWGLEYLFGLLEPPDGDAPDGRYVTFWAHDRAEERQALIDFLDYLRQRRAAHPGMHVYHYAFYEPAALRSLARRHDIGRDEIETLIADGVFVDLYETVKHGVHVSQRSYSIKKLEPLYMGEKLRDADGVTDGGASVVAYAQAVAERDAGDDAGWQAHLHALADYNRYDCESTMRLRDWLLGLRDAEHRNRLQQVVALTAAALGGEAVAEVESAHEQPAQPQPATSRRLRDSEVLARRLTARASEATGETGRPDPALPLLAGALAYHRAENRPYWDAHHARLAAGAPDWFDERDVLDVHRVEAGAWQASASGRLHRRLTVDGRLGAGSTVEVGAEVYCVYRPPLPHGMSARHDEVRATSYAQVRARTRTAEGLDRLELRERLGRDMPPHTMLPMLVTPGPPPRTRTLEEAIAAVARGVLGDGEPIAGAALDVLRRTDPRQRSGGLPSTSDVAADVVDALLDSEDSYLGVQGPPGTGKTALAARVIAQLVNAHGWRVGVVAQSHAVIEHLLERVVEAGVDADRVGRRSGSSHTWRTASGSTLELAASDKAPSDDGLVVGGTVWDMAHRERVPARNLDLLVIEEAGQLSLADAVAAGTAARRLLLVGDPQQLPQVSQARHATPIGTSVLGWLMEGRHVLASRRGYLLEQSWRMHPELCEAVSRLSYDGRLLSAPVAAHRHLDGLAPGVHEVLVEHRGNRARSVEEAAEVVAQVERVLARDWTDESGTRPLHERDVVVVAAYNAQVAAVRAALDEAGLVGVRVGTVDRFQGQQAVVSVLTLAASSAAQAARGLRFLLDRNRINVALSRAQWAAVIVRSPALTRTMPTDPGELADLAAFIELTNHAHPRRRRDHSAESAVAVG